MTAKRRDDHCRVQGEADGHAAMDRARRALGADRAAAAGYPRRFRYPGRRRLPDRPALCGILFVLHTGIAWRHLPPQLGFGSGITCWRRLEEWQNAGVWEELHALLLSRLRAADQIDFSRAVVDSSQVQAKQGAPRRARARSTAAARAPSTTSSSMPPGCRSPAP
jgi:transposase